MSESRITKAISNISKVVSKWPVAVPKSPKDVGYRLPLQDKGRYYNPLLSPPPRSPTTSEDFINPQRLGHWKPFGWDYTNPVADKFYYHEALFSLVVGAIWTTWLYSYAPDLKLREWARREAFIRTHKREALGLPLIERDLVDPARMELPSEEDIGSFRIIW